MCVCHVDPVPQPLLALLGKSKSRAGDLSGSTSSDVRWVVKNDGALW